MTSIATGGGPSLTQRRNFSKLKDGTQVPGYRGYCPQLKYRVGQTYGQDTYELSKEFDHRHPPGPIAPGFSSRPPIINDLPKSTGDNKYTEKMVPGYTGYIPRWPFKYGGTYKDDCDVCIDDHLTNTRRNAEKQRELNKVISAAKQLQVEKVDPEVRDHLRTYRDTHPKRSTFIEDKRRPTEPPIPGYVGYVPRIGTTELGLGDRYHVTSGRGFETFRAETNHHQSVLNKPIDLRSAPGAVRDVGNLYTKRLYLPDGMIPRYTGYLPQRRYQFGNTYGDTTRSLDVCEHTQQCYGDFVRTKPRNLTASLA